MTISHADFDRLCSKLDSVETALEDLRREIRSNGNSSTLRTPLLSGASSPTRIGSGRAEQARYNSAYHTRNTSIQGIHTKNDLTGQTVHLGGSSVPALVMALGQGPAGRASVQEILSKSILPIFGLDNETATYPFVDLWGLAHASLERAEQLAKAIPDDMQCLSFFRYYRDMGHVIFPGVADMEQFEQDLTRFLAARARMEATDSGIPGMPPPGVSERAIYNESLHWIGLLFAVLANGCQCSGLARKERELTSQVYGKLLTIHRRRQQY